MVRLVLLMMRSPAMHGFGAFAKLLRSVALEIVTLPGVGVPAQAVGEISVPQVPAMQVGMSPGHATTFAQLVPHDVVKFR